MINLDKPSLLVKGSLDDIKRYLHTLVDSLQYALEDNEGMISECREKLANYEDGNANIAELELEVKRNSAAIKSQAVTIGANSTNIANLQIESNTQGANISLLVDNGAVKGGVIVEAINDQSFAKISADKLDIEGKELNIKVKSTNIEGELTADQINANGMDIAGFIVTEDALTYEGEDEEGMGVSIELNTGTYPRLSLATLDEDGSLHRATTIDSTGITIHKELGAVFNDGWLTLLAGNVSYILYLDHDTGTVKFRTVGG